MTTLVVGDVHGCVDELRRLVAEVSPERIVCVGDLFTKGPDPVGVYRFLRERGITATLGNHDARMLDVVDGRREESEAKTAVDALEAAEPGWAAWTRALPLFLDVAGWTVVHAGLHPSGELARTTRKMAITLRRWPDELKTDPFWYQVYTGARRVVFGHDARRGLVRIEREGQPWCVGLDTGCCYGGKLSGYVVEEDRVVQVAAARAYRPFVE